MLRKLIALITSLDWLKVLSTVVGLLKKENNEVEDKYLKIRPAVLSDRNLVKGVRLIRTVFSFIPGLTLAAPALSLGETGAQIWKKMALAKPFERLSIQPIDPLIARTVLEMTPETATAFQQELTSAEDLPVVQIYSDLLYITETAVLKAKYPALPEEFLENKARENLTNLNGNLELLENKLISMSQDAQMDYQIREAFTAIKRLFPALQSWALLNSKATDQIIEILDVIV